jgi:hypothetical protein
LLKHLKAKSTAAYGSVLVVILVLLYGVVINKTVPQNLAEQMDSAAAKAEADD